MGKEVSDRLFSPFFFCPVPYFSPQPHLHHFFREINSRMHQYKNDFLCVFFVYAKVKDQTNIEIPKFAWALSWVFATVSELRSCHPVLVCFFLREAERGKRDPFERMMYLSPQKKGNVAQGNTQKKREAEQQGVFFLLWLFSQRKFLI